MQLEFIHTPEGVRDLYGEAYRCQAEAEERIAGTMGEFGYREIRTPALEYFDLFSGDLSLTEESGLFRYYDRNGETLVLRPDFTPSIARSAVKCFPDSTEPLKLCYRGSVFNNRRSLQGKLREETQMGAELYNDGSVEADAEIAALTLACLSAAGLKDVKLVIGHADFFHGICEEAGLGETVTAQLLDAVCDRNTAAAERILSEQEISGVCRGQLLKLADFLAEESELEELLRTATNSRSRSAIERLIALRKLLCARGYADRITFDPGLLNRYRYYTGIVFRAYTPGIGEPIARGGRYDGLLRKFGRPAPAVGFMMVTDDLANALNAEKKEGLTIALGKGRLAREAMRLLERCGISCPEMEEKDTRKLVFSNKEEKLSFFLAKGPDVPTYVEYGAADIGIVGADTILEEDRRVCEVLDLKFGKCRMCVCGRPEAAELLKQRGMLRVATKYPGIARKYFYTEKRQTVELIKLNGSVELGPIVGLSDVIVDIVETGSTLHENGLTVLEEITPLSARVIVNPVSMQTETARIRSLVRRMREALHEAQGG